MKDLQFLLFICLFVCLCTYFCLSHLQKGATRELPSDNTQANSIEDLGVEQFIIDILYSFMSL
jgi:hypothetical protein